MSNLHRIQQLLGFLEEEPDNPFNLYALALEYQHSDPAKATVFFNKLLEEHKGYLPTYYHAALFFSDRDEADKARKIYEAGMVLAQQVHDHHAYRELQNAYQNFLFEN